jgi:hypothetical protein
VCLSRNPLMFTFHKLVFASSTGVRMGSTPSSQCASGVALKTTRTAAHSVCPTASRWVVAHSLGLHTKTMEHATPQQLPCRLQVQLWPATTPHLPRFSQPSTSGRCWHSPWRTSPYQWESPANVVAKAPWTACARQVQIY